MSLVWSPDYAPVDGDFADVSLLLKGEGTNGSTTILDSSSNNLSVVAFNTAQISTAVNTPFGIGDGVLFFDGNSDYVGNAGDLGFAFGTGAFTVETWVNFSSVFGSGIISGIAGTAIATNVADNVSWWIGLQNVGGTPYLVFGRHSSPDYFRTPFTPTLSTWYHIAATRDSSGNVYLFVNGASQVISSAGTWSAINFSRTGPFYAGLIATPFYLDGYLSNLRITKGVARYTENFDVPTAPFPILSPSGRITIADDSLDADARQYIINVEEQDGEELEAGVRTAINDFVVGCKNDGIWNAIKASCLLCGARTLEGALVPLKGVAPTNFNFTLSDYDRELGLVGDGSTKYLDSNRANNADPDANNHNAIYMTTGGNGGKMGASNNKIRNSSFGNRTTTYFTGFGSPSLASVNNSLVGHTRISSSEYTYYIGDTPRTGVVPQAGQSASSDNVFIFDDGFGSRTSSRFAFYSIGENLNLALLDSRISDFITAIGAAIP